MRKSAVNRAMAWHHLVFACVLWLQLCNVFAVTLERDGAYALVEKLPEVRTWMREIPRMTDGTSVGALMALPERPVLLAGWHYWSINFYLYEGIHFHRWETFLVRVDGRRILVNDTVVGPITLAIWRRDRKPYAHMHSAVSGRASNSR